MSITLKDQTFYNKTTDYQNEESKKEESKSNSD